MKAIEFKSQIKENAIKIPDDLRNAFCEGANIRVIVLLEENEYKDQADFRSLTNEQFLEGYVDSDSIYDEE